jgi:hypothetical protein
MLTFREVKKRLRIEGFHCHHLIPTSVTERRSFANFFGNVRAEGFDPNDFSQNGMHLPCCEKRARAFGLPLHRGGHPRYDEFVAEKVAMLVELSPHEACRELSRLQETLRRSLRIRNSGSFRKINDLRNFEVDFRKLECEVRLCYSLAGRE